MEYLLHFSVLEKAITNLHNAVRHTTSILVFLKQSLLLISCPSLSVHIWACTAWLFVTGLPCLLSSYVYVFMPTLCLKYSKVPQPYMKYTSSVIKKLIR